MGRPDLRLISPDVPCAKARSYMHPWLGSFYSSFQNQHNTLCGKCIIIHEGVVVAIGFLQEGVVLGVVVQSYPAGRGRCGEYLKGCGHGVGLGEYLTGRGRCGEYLKGCGHGVGRGPGEYCNYPNETPGRR